MFTEQATEERPVWLSHSSNHRKVTSAGTHRCAPLSATLARAESVKDILGVTRVSNLTGLDVIGLPVFQIVAPSLNAEPRPGLLTVASGKGITPEHAKVSAFMELVERWSARQHFDDVVVCSSFRALRRTHEAIDPAALTELGSLGHDEIVEWTAVREVRTGIRLLCPSSLVFVPTRTPKGFMSPRPGNSNGLAAGNTVTEALLHALLELIERDAKDRCGDVPGASIDLTRLESVPEVADSVARFERAGIDLVVRIVPSLTGVPTMMALSLDRSIAGCRAVCGGLGTHLDPRVALCRAVSELVQSRAVFSAGSREDLGLMEAAHGDFNLDLELQRTKGWWVDPNSPVAIDEIEDLSTDSILDDLEIVLGRLDQAGFPNAYVADLTRPAIGIPVVRAIVPGLRFGGH